MIHLDRYASHHSHIIAIIISGMKYFLMDFRYSIKNSTNTSSIRIAIHARDRVERINSQNSIVGTN